MIQDHYHYHNQITTSTCVSTVQQQAAAGSFGSPMTSKFIMSAPVSASVPASSDITSSLWGPPRVVVLNREPNKSLGKTYLSMQITFLSLYY